MSDHEMDSKLLQQLIDEMDGGDFDDIMKKASPAPDAKAPVHGATVIEITMHPHGKPEEEMEPEMHDDEELPEDLKDILG